MKIKRIKFLPFILLITFFLLGCPFDHNEREKSHEKIFTNINYGALEWKNSYIISASNYLPQVQVWDSDTGKLVKVYKAKFRVFINNLVYKKGVFL